MKLTNRSPNRALSDVRAGEQAKPVPQDEEFGDPELVSMLHSIRKILHARAIRVQMLTESGEPGEVLAAIHSGPALEAGAFDLASLCLTRSGSGRWWPNMRAPGAFHASVIDVSTGYQIVLLSQPAGGNILGRRAMARKIPLCASLVEWAVSHWLRERVAEMGDREQLAVLDLFGFGLLLIDADCRIRAANSTARAILAQSAVISDRGGWFTATSIADAMRFQVSLRHTIYDPDEQPSVVAINRDGALPLMLAMRAIPEGKLLPTMAVVQIIDPAAGLLLPLDSLAHHYGWTQVECRLIEQIVVGKTLGEAAVAMHLKEQTARTYLKHIFQKTGLRRQVELVRLVLASAMPKHPIACGGPQPTFQ